MEEWKTWNFEKAFNHFYEAATKALMKKAGELFDEVYPSGFTEDGLSKEEWLKRRFSHERTHS